jgi:hypothetical protein
MPLPMVLAPWASQATAGGKNEEARPWHRREGLGHAREEDGRNRAGSIMHATDEVERQCRGNKRNQTEGD